MRRNDGHAGEGKVTVKIWGMGNINPNRMRCRAVSHGNREQSNQGVAEPFTTVVGKRQWLSAMVLRFSPGRRFVKTI